MLSFLIFVTALTVAGGALFSVRRVYAYCFNHYDPELEQRILDRLPESGLRRGQSMFTIRDSDVRAALDGYFPNIRVVNIERRFPDRIFVNYVVRFEYFMYARNGQYYIADNTLQIVRIAESNPNLILLRPAAPIEGALAVGSPLIAEGRPDRAAAVEIIAAMERFNFARFSANFFEYVDLSTHNAVVLRTRAGVRFRLNGLNNLTAKLRTAISVFENIEPSHRSTGTIIVTAGNPNRGTWTAGDN